MNETRANIAANFALEELAQKDIIAARKLMVPYALLGLATAGLPGVVVGAGAPFLAGEILAVVARSQKTRI